MLDFLNSDEADPTNTENNLIIGFNAQFPPFGYKDANGEYTGFDIELARAQTPLGNTSAYEFKCPNVELDSKHEWKALTQLTSLHFKNTYFLLEVV